MEPFTSQLESEMRRNKDFPQQLKQQLVQESSKVKNPFDFMVALFNESVLSDESNQQGSSFELTVTVIVQLVIMITCSKGKDAIRALLKALEASGNLELISALPIWAQEDVNAEVDGHLKSTENPGVSIEHTGFKMIDSMMTIIKDELLQQHAGKLVGKAPDIAHFSEDCPTSAQPSGSVLDDPNLEFAPESANFPQVSTNIAHQNEPNIELTNGPSSSLVVQKAQDKNDIQRITGPQVHERQNIGKFISTLISMKVIGPLALSGTLILIYVGFCLNLGFLPEKPDPNSTHGQVIFIMFAFCIIAIVLLLTLKFILWVRSVLIAVWAKIRSATLF